MAKNEQLAKTETSEAVKEELEQAIIRGEIEEINFDPETEKINIKISKRASKKYPYHDFKIKISPKKRSQGINERSYHISIQSGTWSYVIS